MTERAYEGRRIAAPGTPAVETGSEGASMKMRGWTLVLVAGAVVWTLSACQKKEGEDAAAAAARKAGQEQAVPQIAYNYIHRVVTYVEAAAGEGSTAFKVSSTYLR